MANYVAELDGVSGISNNVSPRAAEAQACDVVRQIMRALPRHANIEASNIHVSIADGRVKLEGTILIYPQRELVEEAVWAAAASGRSRITSEWAEAQLAGPAAVTTAGS